MKKKIAYFILFLIFIATSWSLFRPEFFRVHDYTSGARIAEMTLALKDGHFPVRWTQNFGYGYGMPLFEFYGPLPYYVGSIFYWLSGHLVGSLKFLYLIANIGTIIGAYLLGKEWSDRFGGVLAAAAISLAPYRALNLFVRGALNETWGLMALPWILWSLTKLVKGQTRYWFSLTIASLVMVLSHNLTVLISAPFIIGYLLISWFALSSKTKVKKKLSSIKSILWGGTVALLVGAFYWLPSFFEKHLTKMEGLILSGYFDFRLHFLYLRQLFDSEWGFGGSSWGPDDNISFFLGYGQLLTLILLLVFIVHRFVSSIQAKKSWSVALKNITLPLNFGLLFLLATLLTTPKTRFLWDNLSLMKYIQFPWRFMLVMVTLLGLMAALVSKYLPPKFKPYVTAGILILMAVNAQYYRPETYLENASDYYYSDPGKIRTQMSDILPDYIPQSLSKEIEPASQLIRKQNEDTDILVNRTHQKLLKTDFNQNQSITVNLASYPGWTVYLNQDPIKTKTSQEGLISFEVPPGDHLISLIFKPTRIRLLADVLSLFGLLLLALAAVNRQHFQKIITND
jgi:hypothetical protein